MAAANQTGRHRTETGRCDRRRPHCPRPHAHGHGATISRHAARRPCSGTGQGTYGRRPCARNILRPGHTAAQVTVLTLAAPALTTYCVHVIPRTKSTHLRSPPLRSQHTVPMPYCGPSQRTYARRPYAHHMLHTGHAAGQVQCTYARCPCAGFVQSIIPIDAGPPKRIPVLKGFLRLRGAQPDGPPQDANRLPQQAAPALPWAARAQVQPPHLRTPLPSAARQGQAPLASAYASVMLQL